MLVMLLLGASVAPAGEWLFSDAELQKLAAGEVLISASVAGSQGDIRGAVQIQASPETIFRVMTDCAQALEYVPHLEQCTVLDSAEDGSWQVFEQRIDYSWLLPPAHYVFRAEYEPYTRIRTYHISGDFRENRGIWELHPARDGTSTIVTYQAHVVPQFFVPRWMLRSALRRDLPEMLRRLRTRSESISREVSTGPTGPARPSHGRDIDSGG
ncbi:MAG TPA: SRPBCC family protein [Steroidobacteraceae bacterium]